MNKPELSIAVSTCWCSLCGIDIKKGEKYLNIYKSARRGVARLNICPLCLRALTFQLDTSELKAIELRKMMKELKINENEDDKY